VITPWASFARDQNWSYHHPKRFHYTDQLVICPGWEEADGVSVAAVAVVEARDSASALGSKKVVAVRSTELVDWGGQEWSANLNASH
jgi:hypothetical protein